MYWFIQIIFILHLFCTPSSWWIYFTIEGCWMLAGWLDSWGAKSSWFDRVLSDLVERVEAGTAAEWPGICREGWGWQTAAVDSHIDRQRELSECQYLAQLDIRQNEKDPPLEEEEEENHTESQVTGASSALRSHSSVKAGLTDQNSDFSHSEEQN